MLVVVRYIYEMQVDLIIPPDEAIMLSQHLFNLRDKLGIPKTVTEKDMGPVTWKFIGEIVRVWKMAYPAEYREWRDALDYHLGLERDVREAVKGGGFIPISYPERLFRLFKVFIPKVHLNDKGFTRGLLKVVPELKRTNYKL